MATINIAMKVNRAITGATTVNANSYAMVTYNPTSHAIGGGSFSSVGSGSPGGIPYTRYFGPGQSIPATFTTTSPALWSSSPAVLQSSWTTTWTLQGGVELINTQ